MIEAGVGDLVQRIRDGQTQVGYSMAGQSRGRVTLCAVCTVHKETRSAGFLVQPQKQGRQFVSKLYGSFFFFIIFGVFSPDFSSTSLEEFFFDSFHGFGC
jgi:hypothetical protein